MANLTIKEAAAIVDMSVDHTRKLVRDGVIKAKKIGRDYLVTRTALNGIERQRKHKTYKKVKGIKRSNAK